MLAGAPRIGADEVAVDWARNRGTCSGNLDMPVIDVSAETDPRAALSRRPVPGLTYDFLLTGGTVITDAAPTRPS